MGSDPFLSLDAARQRPPHATAAIRCDGGGRMGAIDSVESESLYVSLPSSSHAFSSTIANGVRNRNTLNSTVSVLMNMRCPFHRSTSTTQPNIRTTLLQQQEQKALMLPAKAGQLTVGHVEIPKPGPGDLLVKIEATALNSLDWKIHAFGLFLEEYPAILGFDAAGTVVEVGEGTASNTFAIGDRVLVQSWFDVVRKTTHGAFMQYNTFPTRFAAKIPSSLSFEGAATIPTGLAAAAFPLYNQESTASANLLPPWVARGRNKYARKPILILGGATSTAQYAIQFARLSGFSPIVTTASPHNAAHLASLGATHVLDRKMPAEALKTQATAIAGGLYGVVYDTVALQDTLPLAYALTAPQGTLVAVGPAGDVQAGDEASGKRIVQTLALFSAPANEDVRASLLENLPGLLECEDIKPVRAEVLPNGLSGIPAGLERLKNGCVSGVKLVAKPGVTA